MELWAAPKDRHPDADAVVVVYNLNDKLSFTLAASYVDKRGIPFDRLIGLDCSVNETISRDEFERTIAEPIRKTMIERGWWRMHYDGLEVAESSIQFMVLMRGIPLRIAHRNESWPGDRPESVPDPMKTNAASVDSELAVLGMGKRQISGPIPNPYFRNTSRIRDAALPALLLVCRLDGATPRTVQRMIDDSHVTEQQGLWGFTYIDSRGLTPAKAPGLVMGDDWLRAIVRNATNHGSPVIHEDTEKLFPNDYPMRNAALYFGWYAEHATGPFVTAPNPFARGAVAVHIHSFSATTLRNPGQHWCAPLLEKGAAATLGNVYEPYLHLTPHLDRFEARLRSGATFAEAAYSATPALSWMTTFVGDPLYRPFRVQAENIKVKNEVWAEVAEGLRLWDRSHDRGKAFLEKKSAATKNGLFLEALACLQTAAGEPQAAIRSLDQARQYYRNETDQVRCALHMIGLLGNLGKKDLALAVAKQQLKRTPLGPGTAILKALVNPPPPSPSPSPSSPNKPSKP
ncbi:TIGR03790 family protein [uncultured Pigmentiphaga sp.]|uniref:TIGR03790 family protein n=1 Tax=uncultured Pigmentiphaga sp. TaxID=340361 RepID=UPI0026305421|nr:TIGR03790 family protein [uncultured Pigmentiphaga sp.]